MINKKHKEGVEIDDGKRIIVVLLEENSRVKVKMSEKKQVEKQIFVKLVPKKNSISVEMKNFEPENNENSEMGNNEEEFPISIDLVEENNKTAVLLNGQKNEIKDDMQPNHEEKEKIAIIVKLVEEDGHIAVLLNGEKNEIKEDIQNNQEKNAIIVELVEENDRIAVFFDGQHMRESKKEENKEEPKKEEAKSEEEKTSIKVSLIVHKEHIIVELHPANERSHVSYQREVSDFNKEAIDSLVIENLDEIVRIREDNRKKKEELLKKIEKEREEEDSFGRILGVFQGKIGKEITKFTLKEDFLYADERKIEYAEITSCCKIREQYLSSTEDDEEIQELFESNNEIDDDDERGGIIGYEIDTQKNGRERWFIDEYQSDFEEILLQMIKYHNERKQETTRSEKGEKEEGMAREIRVEEDRFEKEDEEENVERELFLNVSTLSGGDESYEIVHTPKQMSSEVEQLPEIMKVLKNSLFEGDLDLFEETIDPEENRFLRNVELPEKDVYDLFMHTIHSKRLEMFSVVLKHYPAVFRKGKPFQSAISYEYLPPVQILLEHKAEHALLDDGIVDDFHDLHIHAIQRTFPESGIDISLMDVPDSQGWTPLHLCAITNNIGFMIELLKRGADTEAKDLEDERTPLHLAALFGNLDSVRVLLKYKANESSYNYHGLNVLHVAAQYGKVDILEYLVVPNDDLSYNKERISIIPMNSKTDDGFSALFVAARNSKSDCVKYLLDCGIDPDEDIDNELNGLLHYLVSQPCCKKEDRVILNMLIERGASVEKLNVRGESPLFAALNSSKKLSFVTGKDYVDLLIDHHAVLNPVIRRLIQKKQHAQDRYHEIMKAKKMHHFRTMVYDEKLARCRPIAGHTAHSLALDQILVFGGYNPRFTKGRKDYYTNRMCKFKLTIDESKKKKSIGEWRVIKPTSKTRPVPRAFHSSVLFKGKLYVYGGESEKKEARNDFWSYNVKSRKWNLYRSYEKKKTKKMVKLKGKKETEQEVEVVIRPPPLRGHSACVRFESKFDLWDEFDRIQEENEKHEGMEEEEFVVDDPRVEKEMHFEGGEEKLEMRECVLDYREFFNDRNGYKQLPDAPNTVEGTHEMILFGGTLPNGQISNEMWGFHFTTKKWTLKASGLPGRSGHSAVYDSKRDRIIIFGGDGEGKSILSDTCVFDFNFEEDFVFYKMRTTGFVPQRRTQHASILMGDRMFIYGGSNGSNILNDMHCLNVRTRVWNEIKIKTLTPRADLCLVFLNESEPALIGGRNGEVHLLHLPEMTIDDRDEEENSYVQDVTF